LPAKTYQDFSDFLPCFLLPDNIAANKAGVVSRFIISDSNTTMVSGAGVGDL